MMEIEKNTIITLDDGDKYLVARLLEMDNQKFAYIININNKDDDGFVLIKDNKLNVIDDQKLIDKLFECM